MSSDDFAQWLVMCFSLATTGLAEGSDPPFSIDDLKRKWKEHEELIKSFDFVAEGQHFDSGVFQNAIRGMSPLDKDKPKQPATTFPTKRRLLGDSTGRLRLEEDGQVWVPDRGEFAPSTTVTVINGDAQIFLASRTETKDFPIMVVNTAGQAQKRNDRVFPIRLVLDRQSLIVEAGLPIRKCWC